MRCLYLIVLVFSLALRSTLSAQELRTSGDNSPAVITKTLSATYGIRPGIIQELLAIYQAEGLGAADRRQQVEALLDKYKKLQSRQDTLTARQRAVLGIEDQPEVTEALNFDLFLSTRGKNSPAIYAPGGYVEVWYGIAPKAFRSIWDRPEAQQLDLEGFARQLEDQVEKFKTLGEELDVRAKYDPVAQKAKTLLDAGDLEGAERILLDDVFGLNKKTAYRNYEAALVRELNLKYRDTTTMLFRNAVMLDEGNAEYSLRYANNLYTLGQYDEAVTWYERSIVDTDSTTTADLAVRYNNLGSAYDSKGEYDQAIGYYEQALAIDLSIYGETHPEVASIKNNLGLAYSKKGEYDQAIGYYEQALAIDLSIYGETHPEVASIKNNLGSAYDSKGEYDQAIGYYEQALAMLQQFLPARHPHLRIVRGNLSRTCNNAGMALYQAAQYEPALVYFREGLIWSTAIADSSFAVTCLNNIGSSLKHLGQADSALVYLEQGIVIGETLDEQLTAAAAQLPDTIRQHPNFPAWLEQRSHAAVLRRLYFHQAGALHRLGRTEEAAALFTRLKREAIRREDERTVREIEAEGY